MSRNICGVVDRDMLYRKSSSYIKRALESKDAGDLGMAWLFASIALELLGKAVLADRHPFWVVEPRDRGSIFVEVGKKTMMKVKTIAARTVYKKLEEIVPGFDREIMSFCNDVATRRNAELHSGESPFENMCADDWDKRYWDACDKILEYVGSSRERWLDGNKISYSPPYYIEKNAILIVAVILKVDNAKTAFKNKKGAIQKQFPSNDSADLSLVRGMFRGKYDQIWDCTCPACESGAFATGNQIEDPATEKPQYSERSYDELFKRNFIAEEFVCLTCDLQFFIGEEVYIALKDGSYYEKYETREVV